jgi:hypothetical protein
MKELKLNWKPIPEYDPQDRTQMDILIPGMILKYPSGTVFLVGNLNEEGGLCACCDMNERPTHYCNELVEVLKPILKDVK